MLVILIVCGVFFCFVVYLDLTRKPRKLPSKKALAGDEELDEMDTKSDTTDEKDLEELSSQTEEEEVPIPSSQTQEIQEYKEDVPDTPQQFRRMQQSLKRQGVLLQQQAERQAFEQMQMDVSQRMIELGNQGVEIDRKNVELQALLNQIEAQRNLVAVEKKEIQIDGKVVELKELILDLQHRENLIALKDKEFILEGKRLDLKELLVKVIYESNLVEIGKKGLAMAHKELQHAYKVKDLELRETMLSIKNQFENLKLDKKLWKIEQEGDKLVLYRRRLEDMRTNIRQLYAVKMEWLRVREKENQIDVKEERVRLQQTYNETSLKLRQLQLTQRAFDLKKNEQELDKRWKIIQYIEDHWYAGMESKSLRNLNDYADAGFELSSPVVKENKKLRNKIYHLERKYLD